MSNLTVPPTLANRIRAKAKAEGVTISVFLNHLLQSYQPKPRLSKRRSSRVMRQPSLTEQANKVCELVDTSLDPALAKMQAAVLSREKW